MTSSGIDDLAAKVNPVAQERDKVEQELSDFDAGVLDVLEVIGLFLGRSNRSVPWQWYMSSVLCIFEIC